MVYLRRGQLDTVRLLALPLRQPGSFRHKYGDRPLTPSLKPSADVDLDRLSAPVAEAASAAINVPGYRVEAVELPKRRTMSVEEKRLLAERLGRSPGDGRVSAEPQPA